MMPVDPSALLDGNPQDAEDVSLGSRTAKWTGFGPTHGVNIQPLQRARQEHPDLDLPSCCGDRHAAKVVAALGCGCLVLVVAPVLAIVLASVRHLPQAASTVLYSISGALLAIGVCTFLGFFRPLCIVSMNPPSPAPCIPPLVEIKDNNTHRDESNSIRRVAVIYNPHAGKGKACQLLHDVVVPTLRAHGVEVDEVPTERVGHAREIGFKKDFTGYDGVVVMGGDGTIHEVANGLLSRHEPTSSAASAGTPAAPLPPLGLVPLGSGNAIVSDFRQSQRRRGREVSVYRELDAVAEWAAERIADGRSCCVDILEVETVGQRVACIAIAYFGIIADIDVIAEPLRCLGPVRFDIAAFWGLLKRRPMMPCCIRVKGPDGSEEVVTNAREDWLGLSVNLCQHWSDSTRASPTSQLDDGVAELHILKVGPSRRMALKAFTVLATGAHTTLPNATEIVRIIAFTKITLTFPERFELSTVAGAQDVPVGALKPGMFNLDGEIFRHDGTVEMRLQPRKLRLFVDPEEECGSAAAATTPPQARMASPGIFSRESSSETHQVYWQRWLYTAIFCYNLGCNQVLWITFAPIASTTEEAYKVGSTFVNFLSLIFMAVYLLFTFPASKAIDRAGCRPAIIIGAGLTSLGAVLRVVVTQWMQHVDESQKHSLRWGLVLGQAIAAAGQPFFMNMPPKLANVWFPAHQRVSADTICSMSAPLGAAVGFLLPSMITGGNPDKMPLLMIVEACLCIVGFVMALPFQNEPPTPPSAAAAASHGALLAVGERKGIVQESLDAMRDRDFLAVQIAFSMGLGTFNTLATMIDQFVEPFGFTEDDASQFGALTVFFGLIGAAVFAIVLGYSHNHRKTLRMCFVCATVAALLMAVTIPLHSTALVYVGVSLLGFGATPVMPLAFETSVELMHPAVGEATLSGLCVGGGQVVGMAMTLALQSLCQSGHARIAVWIVGIGVLLGAVAISFLRDKSVGARRRTQEGLVRRNTREFRRMSSPRLTGLPEAHCEA